MVRQPADTIVTSPLKASDYIRIEACDPRSDNRRRVVDIAREGITIRRVVAGVSMAIRVDPSAYRGVALRITGLVDGRFHYEVRLAHRDPDLSVPLGEGGDLVAIEAQWRGWVAFLRLPALAGRTEFERYPCLGRRRGTLLRGAARAAAGPRGKWTQVAPPQAPRPGTPAGVGRRRRRSDRFVLWLENRLLTGPERQGVRPPFRSARLGRSE